MLRDRKWKLKYTPDDGDFIRLFYIPALDNAQRYDRLTGYFSANALALASRGIEGLVRNKGHMRLVVGCTLDQKEIEAIVKGEQLRNVIEQKLTEFPLDPANTDSTDALELLAWMVKHEFLEVKVAVPRDKLGNPISTDALFHEKTGIIEDRAGDRIAWTGSLNETGAAWEHNWESISVYTSWGAEPLRVDNEETSFEKIWAGKSNRLTVMNVPEAVRKDLLRFLPENDQPVRLIEKPEREETENSTKPIDTGEISSSEELPRPLKDRVWSFINIAPSLQNGGVRIGEVTAPVDPWPHQVKAFQRLTRDWPPKLLIADEVGLGKTIQAGLLLRHSWLTGRAKRILILAPKAVLKQWQIELREKFNLNWPIYDGKKLIWYPSPAIGNREKEVDRDEWFREPFVIASSHLMRRNDRAMALLEKAKPWDLLVLDEAHHARRRSPGSSNEGGPNKLLKLMQGLKNRINGLILLTATPMQVHPVEIWDLLNLLGLPPEWTDKAFLEYFENLKHPNPSTESLDRMASLFQATERTFCLIETEEVRHLAKLTPLKANKVLKALRNVDTKIQRGKLNTEERGTAIKILKANTPVRRLVSRNTRQLLRRYFQQGKMSTSIADRKVEDRFLEMTPSERLLYQEVEDYISNTYEQASEKERTAVGFVMTVYRRRMASSFVALEKTLRNRRDAIDSGEKTILTCEEEDLPDDETAEEIPDAKEIAQFEREALAYEQKTHIDRLLAVIERLLPDSKLNQLKDVLDELRQERCGQIMVFTQYTHTMDFLREHLVKNTDWRIICFSGRGGEVFGTDEVWNGISRDDAKRRFRDGEADILLCTDAAAEGLNFQFCGALVNYDMPWNPMRVEQRIGRIDRMGQKNSIIRIVNLHLKDTVEADIYSALRKRIGLFETMVGRLQPILAGLSRTINQTLLAGKCQDGQGRANLVDSIERQTMDQKNTGGFDIDDVTDNELEMPTRHLPNITMEDLDRIIASKDLMPIGSDIQKMSLREYSILAPSIYKQVRVTTDTKYFEQHSDSVELWSPGNPLFVPPEYVNVPESSLADKTLKEILDNG